MVAYTYRVSKGDESFTTCGTPALSHILSLYGTELAGPRIARLMNKARVDGKPLIVFDGWRIEEIWP